jgi:hypothetical protein
VSAHERLAHPPRTSHRHSRRRGNSSGPAIHTATLQHTHAPPGTHAQDEAPPPVVDSGMPPPPPSPTRMPGQLRREKAFHAPARRTDCNEPTRMGIRDNRPPHNNNNPPWRVSNDQNAHQQPRTTTNHKAKWCVLTPTHQRTQNAPNRFADRDITNFTTTNRSEPPTLPIDANGDLHAIAGTN